MAEAVMVRHEEEHHELVNGTSSRDSPTLEAAANKALVLVCLTFSKTLDF